jgi:prepilin-type N-terminal cleavage/methylation domain-containing protein
MIRNSSRLNNSGFTLVELMSTLTVGLIVLTLGIPGFSMLLANNQMNATTNDLVSHLHYARNESIKRLQPVAVCPSKDGLQCTGSCEWGEGWIVFTDDTGGTGRLDGSDQLLRYYMPTGKKVDIDSDQEYLRFRSDGSAPI